MPTSVGGIEAVLDTKIGPFVRAMDAGDRRMDQSEAKMKSLVGTAEKLGARLAVIGAGITTAFGLAVKAGEAEMQSLNRTRAVVQAAGGDFDAMHKRIAPVIDDLEALGGAGSDQLIETFGQLFAATNNEAAALESLRIAQELAARGTGSLEQNSTALLAALKGQPDLLVRLDRSLGPLKEKWDAQAEAIGKAKAEAGFAAEAIKVLQARISVPLQTTALTRFGVQMGEIREEVGLTLLTAFEPLINLLTNGIKIFRAFADTGLGRVLTVGTAVVGVIATLGGGALLMGAQFVKAGTDLVGFAKNAGKLGTVAQGIGKTFIGVLAVVAALEIGLQIGNVLLQWDDFRKVVSRVFAALSFGIEKVKGFFGKENQSLAQAYWDIASGKTTVEHDPTKRISIVGAIANKVKELTSATQAATAATGEQVDFGALLNQQLDEQTVATVKLDEVETERHEKIMDRAEEQREALVNPWQEAKNQAIAFGGFAQGVVSNVTDLAGGLADAFATAVTGGIENARQSFGQLFKQFLRQIAVMIARAVFLSAILSFLPGGGTFTGQLGKFFGSSGGGAGTLIGDAIPGPMIADDPVNDQRLRSEGSRVADLFVDGLRGRLAGSSLTQPGLTGSSGVASGAPSFNVQVHEATPRTWIEITDRHIQPRLREREDRQTERG